MNVSDLKREEVKIVDDNPETVLAEMIADYESRSSYPDWHVGCRGRNRVRYD